MFCTINATLISSQNENIQLQCNQLDSISIYSKNAKCVSCFQQSTLCFKWIETLNITPLTWKYHCGKDFGRPLISGIGNNVPSLELHDRTGLIIFQQRLVVCDTKEAYSISKVRYRIALPVSLDVVLHSE